jgi:hypothetical protein
MKIVVRKERDMKLKLFAARGQALILMALAAIGLFAVTGLAIDGSAKFSDRRHAQNAADTAAVAGALALARGDTSWEYDAEQRAFENGYDDSHLRTDVSSNDVWIYNPPNSGPYSDCSDLTHFDCHDYVQVIIDSNVNTYFARVIGIMQTHNHVEAVASLIKENKIGKTVFGGNAVVALSPEGCALMAQGTSNVIINGGGLYSNSDDASCSFQSASCSSVLDVNNPDGSQGAVTMIGGYNAHLGCMPQANLVPAAQQQIPFPPPYQEIAPPAVCSDPVSNGPTGKTVTLSPGHYSAMPPKPSMSSITLQPGVYCIDTTIRANAGDILKVAAGTPGVFLYVKPGGSFTFNGGATVQLWGINADNGSSLAMYKNFLIYLAPNYASGTPTTCTLNGNSADLFTGMIYAPYCNVTIDGTSGSSGFQTQIIGYTVKFSGGANVTLNYDASSNPLSSLTVPLQVGLTR